ncbi:MAG: hypothetical protein HKN32_01345, partial [Flavobacteriales bacterium]|nr:hypothetical protein [Flavobacteriales bacterium]
MRLLLLGLALVCTVSASANQKIKQRIEKLFPGAIVKLLDPRDHFEACYEILIPQKLDHFGDDSGTFMQKIYLFHTGYKAPVHLETEGYWANPYTREMAKILQGNQITVEYRFYG